MLVEYDKPYKDMNQETRDLLRVFLWKEFSKCIGRKVAPGRKTLALNLFDTPVFQRIDKLKEAFNVDSAHTTVNYTNCIVAEGQKMTPLDSDHVAITIRPSIPNPERAKSGVIESITLRLGTKSEAILPESKRKSVERYIESRLG